MSVRVLLLAALVLVLAADSASASVVWAVGDGGNGSAEAKRVARTIAADHPKRVLYLGDVYEHGTAADFRDRFETVYGALRSRMEPTPGNHDWPNHRTGYDPYWLKPHHYSLTVGGWKIISINSETPNDAAQLRYLRRRLAGHRCSLVFMHRPRFTAGAHHSEERVVDRIWRTLRGRARLLLGGHDHNLQRFKRVHGTTQLVIGAGGRERYTVNRADHRLAFSNDTADGALRMQLRPGVARLRIVRADGRVLDRSTARC